MAVGPKKFELQGRFRLYWDWETQQYALALRLIIDGKEHGCRIPLHEEEAPVLTYAPTSGAR